MSKLFAVDASSAVVHEQWYAAERIRSPDLGLPLFCSRLASILYRWRPDKFVVCFDGEQNFRREFMPKYQPQSRWLSTSNKWRVDDTLLQQAYEWCLSQGVPVMQHVNYEAADLAASLFWQNPEDKGAWCSHNMIGFQLIESERVAQLRRFSFSRKTGVREPLWYTWPELAMDIYMFRMRAVPGDIIDYWCMVGLPHQIKGAKLIGNTKAKSLLQDYGSMDGIYNAMGDLKFGSRKANKEELAGLRDMFDRIAILRNMLILRTDVPLPDIDLTPPDLEKFRKNCANFGIS